MASNAFVPPYNRRQQELLQTCRKKLYVLANGCRMSGKTAACLNSICDHAWEKKHGNICMITVSQTVGMDSGVWNELTTYFLPKWIANGFGMEWVKEPFVQGVSKKPTCIVTNKWGRETKIQLESLKNEDEVEKRFKGRKYSMIYVTELSNFKNRATFNTWTECLRMVGASDEEHLFLADTNPSEEGTRSWIYNLWFTVLKGDPDDLSEADRGLQKDLAREDFTLDDNTFVSEKRKQQLKDKYADNPDVFARYIRGEWVEASSDAIFYQVFRPLFHVKGELETRVNPDPEMMYPEAGCMELITGWDPGPRNCAAVILEKVNRTEPDLLSKPVFKVLDEQVVIGEDVDLDVFVKKFMERMAYWQAQAGGKVIWWHYSDKNVFDMRDMGSQKYWHQLIYEASNGKIVLIPAEKGPGSVAPGIDLVRRLLWEERLFVNANTCPHMIQMFKSIKRGKSEYSAVDKTSQYKHVLDALRYPLQTICYSEINRKIVLGLRKKTESSLIEVPY